MMHVNGNTIGNNGLRTRGQIEHALSLKVGDRVRFTQAHKLALRDHKLALPTDDEPGVIVSEGMPNAVFVVGWDRGERTMVHANFLERVAVDD